VTDARGHAAGAGSGPGHGHPAIPPWLRRVYAAPNLVYDRGAGWLFGHRFLRVEHVGRRSGRTYRTVLEVVRYDPISGEAVVMAGYGRGADWFRNVRAAGQARVEFGHGPRPATVRLLDDDAAVEALAGYEQRNRFMAPLVRATLSRLVGWRYDGSPDARRRLVEERPLVAFRPAVAEPPPGADASGGAGGTPVPPS
jgi:deazaflavin-dependent oxidoreductase (nitroreductase family)